MKQILQHLIDFAKGLYDNLGTDLILTDSHAKLSMLEDNYINVSFFFAANKRYKDALSETLVDAIYDKTYKTFDPLRSEVNKIIEDFGLEVDGELEVLVSIYDTINNTTVEVSFEGAPRENKK